MKLLYGGLSVVVILFVCIAMTTSSEAERIKDYTLRCEKAGGVVAKWSTDSGPPHTRSISRTCVDPKIILKVE